MSKVIDPYTDRRCKLNFMSVMFIRKCRTSRYFTLQRVLAKSHGVHQSTISRVENYVTWKEV